MVWRVFTKEYWRGKNSTSVNPFSDDATPGTAEASLDATAETTKSKTSGRKITLTFNPGKEDEEKITYSVTNESIIKAIDEHKNSDNPKGPINNLRVTGKLTNEDIKFLGQNPRIEGIVFKDVDFEGLELGPLKAKKAINVDGTKYKGRDEITKFTKDPEAAGLKPIKFADEKRGINFTLSNTELIKLHKSGEYKEKKGLDFTCSMHGFTLDDHSTLTPDDIKFISHNMPNLKTLKITGRNFTEPELQDIARLKNLETLELTDEKGDKVELPGKPGKAAVKPKDSEKTVADATPAVAASDAAKAPKFVVTRYATPSEERKVSYKKEYNTAVVDKKGMEEIIKEQFEKFGEKDKNTKKVDFSAKPELEEKHKALAKLFSTVNKANAVKLVGKIVDGEEQLSLKFDVSNVKQEKMLGLIEFLQKSKVEFTQVMSEGKNVIEFKGLKNEVSAEIFNLTSQQRVAALANSRVGERTK